MIMFELSEQQVTEVAGGYTLGGILGGIQTAWKVGSAFVVGIEAVGATLSNYYGEAMTIEIVAAGNMAA